MYRHYSVQNHWDFPGFYVGEDNNFDDLVDFWNLRAADISLEFDIRRVDRLGAKAAHWAATIRQAPPRPFGPRGLALWHRPECAVDDATERFGDGALRVFRVDTPIWKR
jgi:hypothetical protein